MFLKQCVFLKQVWNSLAASDHVMKRTVHGLVYKVARTLLVAPGITTRNKKLLATRALLLVARTLLVAQEVEL